MGIDKLKTAPRTSLEALESTPCGLDFDARNLFTGALLELCNASPSSNFETLETLCTYEEYIRGNNSQENAEILLKKSNPENVKRVNALIAEYNRMLPRIKSEKNAQLGREILGRINKVFTDTD